MIPFLVIFFLFQIAPMLWIFINSFIFENHYSFENYRQIFDSAFILKGFTNSLHLSLYSSLISLFIATIFVYSLRQVDSFIRNWVISFTNYGQKF